jgi:hypothetical protein
MLALALEDPGDRILGQPVDLQIGDERSQLAGDRDVAPRVPQPDRRRDVERSATAAVRALPGPVSVPAEVREVAQLEVEADGIAGV